MVLKKSYALLWGDSQRTFNGCHKIARALFHGRNETRAAGANAIFDEDGVEQGLASDRGR
jgi:hypothetical protein